MLHGLETTNARLLLFTTVAFLDSAKAPFAVPPGARQIAAA